MEQYKDERDFRFKNPSGIYICDRCGAFTTDRYICDRCGSQANRLFDGYTVCIGGVRQKIFRPIETEQQTRSEND